MADIDDVLNAIQKLDSKNDISHEKIFDKINKHGEEIAVLKMAAAQKPDYTCIKETDIKEMQKDVAKLSTRQNTIWAIMSAIGLAALGIFTGFFKRLFGAE